MNVVSRRPADTPFKQQRLHAWQPILTPTWVISTFFIIGILFLPVGYTLLSQSNSVVEIIHTYDGKDNDIPADCKISSSDDKGKTCSVTMEVEEDMSAPVYLYYEITNFYQNHRKYVKSLSFAQCRGETVDEATLSSDCSPLDKYTDSNGDKQMISPCGLIANSMFNDVITLNSSSTVTTSPISLDEKGIAWESDLNDKFHNPDGFKRHQCETQSECQALCDSVEDVYDCGADGNAYAASDGTFWAYHYPNDASTRYLYETYPDVVAPYEGVKNEHFIVWMRTAGLPKFRKLYGKIDTDLKKGDKVVFQIINNFDVVSFAGSKGLVLSTVSWFGGKNPFLGQSYMAVGGICLVLAAVFGIKHMLNPRKLGDTRYLVWKEA